jgi:hypothetical protein
MRLPAMYTRNTKRGTIMEDVVRQPVELIDEDLDEVAGGSHDHQQATFSHSFNGVGNDAISNNGNIVNSFD